MSEAGKRLIEVAFPLEQVSADSVHEKNVRHGHISTLHIWPARRPLAASRGVILSTLLPDPGDADGRRRALERMAGHWMTIRDDAGEVVDKVWKDGIFHWGKENRRELDAFREEVREAFGGRAPRVLDPFAGGGAIPLEAMRLGCEVEAADLNPVAWFILRCALHYPKLTSGERRLPERLSAYPAFGEARRWAADREAARAGGRRRGRKRKEDPEAGPALLTPGRADAPAVPFAWHLRAWGERALAGARRELAARYPAYADFEPKRRKGRGRAYAPAETPFEPRPMRRLAPDDQGQVSVEALNREFGEDYLEDERNPRWVAKPPVAYLWARTARCAGCRAEVPLLKTRWLCRKPGSASRPAKRVLLTLTPREDGSGVDFGLDLEVPEEDGTPASRRESDRKRGAGTMSRRGATCPCCGAVATMADLRQEGRAGRLGERMTAVVVDGQRGKEYRLPTEAEFAAAEVGEEELEALYAGIPFGLPGEPTPKSGMGASRAFSVRGYGFDTWRSLFTNRQLLALGVLLREIRECAGEMGEYPDPWREALWVTLSNALSKFADYGSAVCSWHNSGEKLRSTFARFALPIVWDYCEVNTLAATTGGFLASVEWVARVMTHLAGIESASPPSVRRRSATEAIPGEFDLICTDPPYYDAIPYSDLMDFFHLWLRRALHGVSGETDDALASALGPKWDADAADGELIDDANRFDGSREASKRNYEDGMARCFARFRDALRDDGRFVVVFASKDPNAWETLVSAIIRSGFVVTASWPIRTEMATRQRGRASAALASSIWLVCRKRSAAASRGWDTRVLTAMRRNIREQLHRFWDAGIRGPDFVWAATGPALEAFSRHPVVARADEEVGRMGVAEFLGQVRREVVGFAVSRVLAREEGEADSSLVEGLDDPTTYYLLHRKDFGLDPAPSGACILYSLSCGVSDSDLTGRLDFLARKESRGAGDEETEAEDDGGDAADKLRLKPWHRRRSSLGVPGTDGSPPPLIDVLHRTMRLWREGDRGKVDACIASTGIAESELFGRVLQAVIEMAEPDSDERSLLESIQNHVPAFRAAAPAPSGPRRAQLPFAAPSDPEPS